MDTKRKNIILACFILLFFALLVLSETRAEGSELYGGVGTSHSVLGALGMDATAAALGWSVTAVDQGLAGMDYNPASGAELVTRSFHMAHLNWVMDSNITRAALGLPIRGLGTMSVGLLHFDQGTIDEVLEDGSYTGERLGARDIQISLGLARPWIGYFNYGFKLTAFHKTLGWERSAGVMASLGVMTSQQNGFRVGAALLNYGPDLRFREISDPAPLRLALGASYLSELSDRFSLRTSVNFVRPRDNYSSFGIGSEWTYAGMFILRGGYSRTLLEDDTPDGDRFGYGFGIKLDGYRFDYAFASKDVFENVHRLSITFDFGPLVDREGQEAIAHTVFRKAAAYDSLAASMGSDSLASETTELSPRPLPRVVMLQGIRFELDSADINEASRPLLDEIFGRLVNTPEVEGIEIQGHTDETGNDEHNLRLSLARAKSVRDYLVEMGYPTRKIGVRGFGKTRPLLSGATEQGRAANRRIEIHLIRRLPGRR